MAGDDNTGISVMSDATTAHYSSRGFRLESGEVLRTVDIAYETYGSPENAPENTILLLHGYTSNPHAAGGGESNPGWWENLIGPGRAIDTDEYFVVSPNMLGSSYGTTGPGSINPDTQEPYGPDFPHITARDMIEVHKLLLDELGAERLAAVIGYSYGGYLTFQWAVTYPDRMRALVPVATGITGRGDERLVRELEAHFEKATGWNGGHYYKTAHGVTDALTAFRTNVLRSYGVDTELRDRGHDDDAVAAELERQAKGWAETFDANSLITLRRCAVRFDAKPEVAKIAAPLLYVLATTDNLFGPDLGAPTVEFLNAVAGIDASYYEIDSPYGHRAPSVDWNKWSDRLRAFLRQKASLKVDAN